MSRVNKHTTVILLMDGESSASNKFLKEWLDKSSFMTNETTDIFDALERISDFTMPTRPDVVLVKVDSLKQDFAAIYSIMQCFSGIDEFPILALSDSGKVIDHQECFEGDFVEVKAQIIKVLPRAAQTASFY